MVSVDEALVVWGERNRQALAIARSLHAAGFFVIFASTDGTGFVDKSQSVDFVWRHPPFETEPQAFLAALHDLVANRNEVRFIYPTDDREIEFLAEHKDSLPAGLLPVMPAPIIASTCQHKARMMKIIDHLNIPQATYRVAENREQVRGAFDELGFPCIARPTRPGRRLFGRKAYICTSAAESMLLVESWPQGHDMIVIQSWVNGFRHNVTFAASLGQIEVAYQSCASRTNAVDGTGLACMTESVPMDDNLLKWTQRLTRHLQYTGVGVAQFIVNSNTQEASFLELNPRVGGSTTALSAALGIDFPVMSVDFARGQIQSTIRPQFRYVAGVQCSSIHLDLSSMLKAYRGKRIGLLGAIKWTKDALTTFVVADTDTIWSWRDPMPGLYGFAMPFLRRIHNHH